MKLYQKLTSLLVAAVMAAVLMPVCMAAPGDSVETASTTRSHSAPAQSCIRRSSPLPPMAPPRP